LLPQLPGSLATKPGSTDPVERRCERTLTASATMPPLGTEDA
jgi:hypothetical protein